MHSPSGSALPPGGIMASAKALYNAAKIQRIQIVNKPGGAAKKASIAALSQSPKHLMQT